MSPQDTGRSNASTGDGAPAAGPNVPRPEHVLETADQVLDPFYETLLGVVVRSLAGDDRLPPLDPPSELVPFLRLKPRKAIAQANVRHALRKLYLEADGLADSVDERHESIDTEPSTYTALAAGHEGDVRGLSRIASAAAAHRVAGWREIVLVAGAVAIGLERGEHAGADAADRRHTREVRELENSRARLEKQIEKSETKLRKRKSELDAARSRLRDLHRDIEATAAERDRAVRERDEVQAHAEATADDARRSIADLEASLTEQRAAHDQLAAEAAGLRSRIRRLEAAKLPNLEAQAKTLEALADDLRRVGEDEPGPSGTDRSPGPDAADTADERAAPSGHRAARGAGAELGLPKGMRPDTSDALRWALGQPNMLVLVDGYNVTNQQRRGWSDLRGGDQRQLLISHLARLLKPRGAEIHVVFDAAEPDSFVGRRTRDGISIEFSGGTIADDRIVEIVDALEPDREALAVTSDRELQARMRDRGVPSVRSELLLEFLGTPRR